MKILGKVIEKNLRQNSFLVVAGWKLEVYRNRTLSWLFFNNFPKIYGSCMYHFRGTTRNLSGRGGFLQKGHLDNHFICNNRASKFYLLSPYSLLVVPLSCLSSNNHKVNFPERSWMTTSGNKRVQLCIPKDKTLYTDLLVHLFKWICQSLLVMKNFQMNASSFCTMLAVRIIKWFNISLPALTVGICCSATLDAFINGDIKPNFRLCFFKNISLYCFRMAIALL